MMPSSESPLTTTATACAGGHVSTVGDGSMEKVAATGLWSEVETPGKASSESCSMWSASGGIDVLLGRQNARGKGPSRRGTWSFIGGKREEVESCSMATAAREAHEESQNHNLLTSEGRSAYASRMRAIQLEREKEEQEMRSEEQQEML